MSIARAYHISLSELKSLNPDIQPEYIQPAQRIKVPAAQQPQEQGNYISYIVKRKDTMYSLAKTYGITIDELVAANPQLQEADSKLKKGTILRIPVKQPTSHAAPLAQLQDIKVAVVLPLLATDLNTNAASNFTAACY